MTSIVLTYFNRLRQLLNTLDSFDRYDNDFEVIIVDDGSDLKLSFSARFFPVRVIHLTEKPYFNSGIPFNIGFEEALKSDPDIVILQNAECYHAGDIMGYAEQHLTDSNYIAFPCYSLAENDSLPPLTMNNRCATSDGDGAWYNHPVYRPVGYHFCAAITAENLRKLNGFDERFKDGHDYEDNYWLYQVKTLGLRVDIPEQPYVFHQWHYSTPRKRGPVNNEILYRELSKRGDYRAVHLLTDDL